MIQQKFRQEMFTKPGVPQPEEMLSVQVKNTTLHLNGQNLRLAAKNGLNSKTPGLHLSVKHEKEAVGQPMEFPPAQESTTQSNMLLLKSSVHDLDREAENQSVRRPMKLAPLELPEEVRKAQKQKLKFVQQEVKSACCKQDVVLIEPRESKVKSSVRLGLVTTAACPSAYTDPPKTQHQNRFSSPQLSRINPTEQRADKHLKDVVCQGTPAPLCRKPAPLLLSPRVKAQVRQGREVGFQKTTVLQPETLRRRLRLSRAQCLEEDQFKSNMSTLSGEEGSLAKIVQGEGQQAESAPRRQPKPGIRIKKSSETSCEQKSVWKSHQKDGSQPSERHTVDRQSEAGGSKCTLDSVKLSDSKSRLKQKKSLITKHSDTVPLEL